MALTEIPIELSSTPSIVDGGNATAITISSTELVTVANGLTLTDGNVVVANGHGIDFSATSGSGTSELLDDYEEGAWTPVVADAASGGNTGGFAGYSPGGTYTKIGRTVYINCILNQITTTGMTGTASLVVRGLPFTVGGQTSFGTLYTYRVSRHADTVSSISNAPASSTICNFPYFVAASATVDKSTLVSDIISNTSAVGFTIVYQTA